MRFFCENRLCRCNVELPDGMQVMRYTEANGAAVSIGCRRIGNADTREEFSFCEICANAVAMVFGLKKPNP